MKSVTTQNRRSQHKRAQGHVNAGSVVQVRTPVPQGAAVVPSAPKIPASIQFDINWDEVILLADTEVASMVSRHPVLPNDWPATRIKFHIMTAAAGALLRQSHDCRLSEREAIRQAANHLFRGFGPQRRPKNRRKQLKARSLRKRIR